MLCVLGVHMYDSNYNLIYFLCLLLYFYLFFIIAFLEEFFLEVIGNINSSVESEGFGLPGPLSVSPFVNCALCQPLR